MRILVLGNGFDVEHKLRTSYIDFLKFSSWIINTFEKKDPKTYKGQVFYSIHYDELKEQSPQIIEELYSEIKDNIWIDYFNRVNEKIGKNWIDFESEISNVVQVFEKARNEYIKEVEFYTSEIHCTECFQNFHYALYGQISKAGVVSGKKFDEIYESMLKDLNKVIRALEIYLTYWVEKTIVSTMNPDIVRIRPDRIISFNYTHTFDKVYGKSDYGMEYSYIHGETNSNSNLDKCKMVLGIDDYEEGIADKSGGNLISFKKYYQRLDKDCSTEYKKWIQELSSKKDEKHEVYIFGHSLDVTDKEILEPIITLDNVNTTVFCHNNEKRSELIANLIKMCGKEKIIKKIYEGSVTFLIQSKSREIHDSELEVKTDIQKLYHIEDYNFTEIKEIIDKVKSKIINEDYRYFNNLSYVVDVVDALSAINLWDNSSMESIKNIVSKLISSNCEELHFLDASEWVDIDTRVTRQTTVEAVDNINGLVDEVLFKPAPIEMRVNPNGVGIKEMNSSDFEYMFVEAFKYCLEKDGFNDEMMKLLLNYVFNNWKVAEKACEEAKTTFFEEEELGDLWKIYLSVIGGKIAEAKRKLPHQIEFATE